MTTSSKFIIEYIANTCLYNCSLELEELYDSCYDIVDNTVDGHLSGILKTEYPNLSPYMELVDLDIYDSQHFTIGFDSYYTFYVTATMVLDTKMTKNDINKLKLKHPDEMAKKEYGIFDDSIN